MGLKIQISKEDGANGDLICFYWDYISVITCHAWYGGLCYSKNGTQPLKQLSEEEKRKAERLRREVNNMLSYVGEPQEEIHID